jgi:hypothetical protein
VTSPATVGELASAVVLEPRWRIEGSGSKSAWLGPGEAPVLSTARLSGVVDFSPADQVVVALAGTPVAGLQAELREAGQCLPIPDSEEHGDRLAGWPGTVGGLVACAMPHAWMAVHGAVRDWVLGAQLVRADGTVARSGSRVVKSVAGFDVHRMVAGAWGRWAVIAEVAFRTFPVRGLRPVPAAHAGSGPCYVARYLRRSFGIAAAREGVLAAEAGSGTVWSLDRPGEDAAWWVGPGGEAKADPAHEVFRRRLDDALDPGGRFSWAR